MGYLIQCEKITNTKVYKKRKHDKKKTKLCAKIIKNDFINHIPNIQTTIDKAFNGKTKSLSKSNIHDSLLRKIYFPYHKNRKSHNVSKIVEKYERTSNTILSDIGTLTHNIDDSLKVWYKPLPIIFTFEAILLYSNLIMLREGFEQHTLKNGLTVWFRKGCDNNNSTILFFHAISGGLIVQSKFIKTLPKTHDIIIPEIPGIAFGGRVFVPPTVRQISDIIIDFVIHKQSKALQLISHSFGGNIISCIINNHINRLESNGIKIINTILVEPVIFLPSLFSVYNMINSEINFNHFIECLKNNKSKLLSYIFISRDIYVQYYAKCLMMTDVLMGVTKFEKENKINIIFVENDEIYSAPECAKYLENKNYNCSITMFKNKGHGHFCHDIEMHQKVISLIL